MMSLVQAVPSQFSDPVRVANALVSMVRFHRTGVGSLEEASLSLMAGVFGVPITRVMEVAGGWADEAAAKLASFSRN